MVSYLITYEGDLRTKTVHERNSSLLVTDAPLDNRGKGESFSPTDLLAVSLGSCILTVMGIQAKALGVEIKGALAKVEKIMSAKPPRKIEKIVIAIALPYVKETLQKALQKAGMGCPVFLSLHPDIEKKVTFTWEKK